MNKIRVCFAGDFCPNAGYEKLILVKGEPYEISNNVLKGKSKDIYYYEKSKNRLGNIAYKFEVILENNFIIGWKDRENRGTKGR
jgi:hypothetical protein